MVGQLHKILHESFLEGDEYFTGFFYLNVKISVFENHRRGPLALFECAMVIGNVSVLYLFDFIKILICFKLTRTCLSLVT